MWLRPYLIKRRCLPSSVNATPSVLHTRMMNTAARWKGVSYGAGGAAHGSAAAARSATSDDRAACSACTVEVKFLIVSVRFLKSWFAMRGCRSEDVSPGKVLQRDVTERFVPSLYRAEALASAQNASRLTCKRDDVRAKQAGGRAEQRRHRHFVLAGSSRGTRAQLAPCRAAQGARWRLSSVVVARKSFMWYCPAPGELASGTHVDRPQKGLLSGIPTQRYVRDYAIHNASLFDDTFRGTVKPHPVG